MTVAVEEVGNILCPNCSGATILLWVRKTLSSSIPLCTDCFIELKKKSRKKASKYQIHFAPKIIRSDLDEWSVSSERHYGFRELKRFIDRCLDPQSRVSDRDSPITKDKEILLQLVDLLFSLIPNLVPQSFEEFKEIQDLHIAPNTSTEKQKLLIRIWEARARAKYETYLSVFNRTHRKELQKIEIRRRIATRLRSEVKGIDGKHYLKGAKKVFWRMLPPGKHPFASILNHFRTLQYNSGIRYDEERLKKIYSLGPTATYIGTDEFKGYVAFYFEDLHIAVLDCHKVGNALYVMNRDWQSLSQLSKAALRINYPDEVERIVHSDTWFRRLRTLLNTHGWKPGRR